jgi:hypothetical protein
MSTYAVFDDLVSRGEFAAAEYLLAEWPDKPERVSADLSRKLESARENRAAALKQRVRELTRRAEATGVRFAQPDLVGLTDLVRSRVAAAEAVLRPLTSDFDERVETRCAELRQRIAEQEQSAATNAGRLASERIRALLRAGELVAVQALLDWEPLGAPIPEAALPLPARTNRWTPDEMLRYHLNPTLSRPPEFAAWKPSGAAAVHLLQAFDRLGAQHSPEIAAEFATALAAFLGARAPKAVANQAEGGYLTVLNGMFDGDRLSRLHPYGKVDLYVASPGTRVVPPGVASMPPHVAVGPDLVAAGYTDRRSTAMLSLADLLRLVVLPADRAVGLLRVIAPQWPVDALIGDGPSALERILGEDAATRWLTLRWITHLSLGGVASAAFSMEQCSGMDPALLRVVLRYSQDVGPGLWDAQEEGWRNDEVLRQALRDDVLARCGSWESQAAWWAVLATCDAESGRIRREEALECAEIYATSNGVRDEINTGLEVLIAKGLLIPEPSDVWLRVPLSGAVQALRPEAEDRLITLLEQMARQAVKLAVAEPEKGWTCWHRNRFAVTEAYSAYVEAETAGATPERLAAFAAESMRELSNGTFAELRPATAKLSELLEVLVAEWQNQYPGIHPDLRCAPLLQVAVPEAVVRAVLYEVLDNAAEAMPGDGNWIVQVSVRVESPEILIDVRDNGPGLPAEAHGRRIFGKDWSTRGPNRGAGLHRARQLLRGFSNSDVEAAVEVLDAAHPTLTGAALRIVLPEHAD